MYEAFYGFRTQPFSLLPDPEFLYLGPRHRMALSLLEYGLLNRAIFTVITGEPGTGKTTLLNKVLDQSQQTFTLGVLSNINVGCQSLMPWVFTAFGLESKGKETVELCREFSFFLLREHDNQHRVLLVVDEAQNLGPVVLEELRLLSNLNDGKRHGLQIILSGQPTLRHLLQRSDMTQFAQRVAVDYKLEPFEREDTLAYIRHRVAVAGCPAPLFTDQACGLAYLLTGGNPRLINQLCDTALAYGYAEQSRWITAKLMSQVARDRSQGGLLPIASLSEPLSQAIDEAEERRQIESAGPDRRATATVTKPDAAVTPERLYHRGLALKQAGQFKQAVEHFERAAGDPAYSVKASTQAGLCFKASGRFGDAAQAFRRALESATISSQDRLQLCYVLGRTLEALGRTSEAVDTYRQMLRDAPEYRDTSQRLRLLNGHYSLSLRTFPLAHGSWMKGLRRGWHHLLRLSS
jgi:type II secretory pathway predicted ATPase ExeA